MTKRSESPPGSSPEPARDRVEATVLEGLTNGMFRLQLTDGREVVAHAALDLRKVFTRLLAGDRVLVEVSPFDRNRARICNIVKSTRDHQPSTRRSG